MKEEIPYLRLTKLALMTAPLFGILGAVPAFAMDRPEYSRILSGFALVVGVSLLYWALNILLLRLFAKSSFRGNVLLRYLISIVLSTLAGVLVFHWFFTNMKPPDPGSFPETLYHAAVRRAMPLHTIGAFLPKAPGELPGCSASRRRWHTGRSRRGRSNRWAFATAAPCVLRAGSSTAGVRRSGTIPRNSRLTPACPVRRSSARG